MTVVFVVLGLAALAGVVVAVAVYDMRTHPRRPADWYEDPAAYEPERYKESLNDGYFGLSIGAAVARSVMDDVAAEEKAKGAGHKPGEPPAQN